MEVSPSTFDLGVSIYPLVPQGLCIHRFVYHVQYQKLVDPDIRESPAYCLLALGGGSVLVGIAAISRSRGSVGATMGHHGTAG